MVTNNNRPKTSAKVSPPARSRRKRAMSTPKSRSKTVKARKKRGLLITFEGPQGSGKTAQISRISTRFEDAGYNVVVTREPGGTEIGEEIRHLLKHGTSNRNMTPETELLLFAASRAQLVREIFIPSLKKGKSSSATAFSTPPLFTRESVARFLRNRSISSTPLRWET